MKRYNNKKRVLHLNKGKCQISSLQIENPFKIETSYLSD